ncbi:hypothetical protein JK386_03310 [Nocardioides sp. zg-536]|uniref:Uncharacterized protein n=1 Tax=Nocardioides faecalis TaxID=2803858 RepID=A0A938Y4A5_9ACTN|nr:hypothetical protein [Nocardioides faecalis]MBM9458917.1 hypothetical protein [Nocardioides faecalis]QVI60318.1 hypothetical protein KG111_08570 [Nocardioides faecalis]
MERARHENVATVLVDPALLPELELELMELDLRVWPVRTAPNCVDGPRAAFQLRRRLVEAQRGAWDCAAGWVPVWISFGESWYVGAEPLPWAAHRTLWDALAGHAAQVRYQRRLGGVPPLAVRSERRRAG